MTDKSKYEIAAERLRQCRLENKLTQEQIGTLCGVNKSTVGRWENGKIKDVSISTFQLLSSYYGVDVAWLTGLDVPKKREPPLSDGRDYSFLDDLSPDERNSVKAFVELLKSQRNQ